MDTLICLNCKSNSGLLLIVTLKLLGSKSRDFSISDSLMIGWISYSPGFTEKQKAPLESVEVVKDTSFPCNLIDRLIGNSASFMVILPHTSNASTLTIGKFGLVGEI